MTQLPIESMNLMMLNVGCATHHADWNWQKVSSPFIRIFYVVEGEAILHLPEKDVKLSPRHMYIIPAYTVHSYECHGIFKLYYIHIYEGFRNEANLQDTYELPTEVTADNGIEQLFEYVSSQQPEAKLPEPDPKSYDTSTKMSGYVERYQKMALWEKMELRGAMLMIMSHFIKEAKPRIWTSDDRMKQVLKHIHEHIADGIDVEVLANVACVTKTYFIRLFRQEFGLSPVQYINRKKVERAQLLLFSTDMPVKEVAYKMGISDHSYFIRLFRKVTGTTPQEYRRQLRT
ncbi:MAG: helix-turn-helix transcriptional regulator [Bacteroidaceae bacterium]|nr:helix-turn-helix transcriptional regulator [Bacteroidaceae bacterium]